MHLEDESTDLKLHAHLCSERYQGIQEQFESLEKRIENVDRKVDQVFDTLTEGNKSMRNTIITSAVTIVVCLIGVISSIGITTL